MGSVQRLRSSTLAAGNSEFRTQLSTYLRAKAELLASVTAQRTLTGSGREIALVQYFEGLVPRRFEVLTGTVLVPPAQGKFEAQVDLMFVNTHDYPVLVREGSLAVVVPQSVHATIEVKTKVDANSLETEALPQIRRANRCLASADGERACLSILFCYGTPAKLATLKGNLSAAWENARMKGDWQASDFADVIITSGASEACIAVRKPVVDNAVTYTLSTIAPADAISQLIYRVLETLSPAQQDPFIESGRATILSYFIEAHPSISDELTLALPLPPSPTGVPS
jgi:hypothetical protein